MRPKVYKAFKVVVNIHKGVLKSPTGCGNRLVYCKGKWTRPRKGDGPLCVFDTRALAERFISHDLGVGCGEVRKCWYKPSNQTSIWFVSYSPSGERRYCHTTDLFSLPPGTRLATAVKLYSGGRKSVSRMGVTSYV